MDRWRYNSIKKILYFKIIFGKYMDRATCIHALSDLELKGLLKAGIKGNFTVIPNGIRVEDYQNLPKNYAEKIWPDIDKSLVCLYMGRLSPEKGIELHITSWAEVIKQHKEAKLLIAGEGTIKYKEKLRNQIKKLGLESYVLFIGLLDDFKKKVALGRADVYVQASYSEGMSNSILEAMVSGKPCVITKGCNFPSIAEWAAGEVVEPDPISMSQAILRILSLSQRERIDMGQKGKYEVINNFSWEKIALKYYKVYECILNNETIPLKP
jgi:glycosyltransferase involved in cell wall biosynthesis